MTVVLARGRRIFNRASGHHHRRHSIDHVRRRDGDQANTGSLRNRHRSRSTDSSSSDSSTSTSSISSTVSEPPEMPVPHTHEPSSGGPFTKGPPNEHEPGRMTDANYMADYGFGRPLGGPLPDMRRGRVLRGRGFEGRGFEGRGFEGRGFGGRGFGGRGFGRRGSWGDPGWNSGRGRCASGVPGPSTMPLGGGEPGGFPAYRDQKQAWKDHKQEWKHERRAEKRAWKSEKRGMKHEHRRVKRAMKHERRQRRREARVMRYGEESSRGNRPWKLIISYHGVRGEPGQL